MLPVPATLDSSVVNAFDALLAKRIPSGPKLTEPTPATVPMLIEPGLTTLVDVWVNDEVRNAPDEIVSVPVGVRLTAPVELLLITRAPIVWLLLVVIAAAAVTFTLTMSPAPPLSVPADV